MIEGYDLWISALGADGFVCLITDKFQAFHLMGGWGVIPATRFARYLPFGSGSAVAIKSLQFVWYTFLQYALKTYASSAYIRIVKSPPYWLAS